MDNTPEMIMIDSGEFDEMEADLIYWTTATSMLSELLIANNIEHEVTDQTVAEYLEGKESLGY